MEETSQEDATPQEEEDEGEGIDGESCLVEMPFRDALRKHVGRMSGNAMRDQRTHEIAHDIGVVTTSVPLPQHAGLRLPHLSLVEDPQSLHWGGHVW